MSYTWGGGGEGSYFYREGGGEGREGKEGKGAVPQK